VPIVDIYFSGKVAALDDPAPDDPNNRLLLQDTDVLKMYSGEDLVYVIRTAGSLWVAARNAAHAAGIGETSVGVDQLTLVQIGSDTWAAIATNGRNTYGIKSDGTLWFWGENTEGYHGVGDSLPRYSPAQVGASSDWATVAFDGSTALFVKTTGTLWGVGSNLSGNLGLGHNSQVLSVTQIGTDSDWAAVDTAGHTLAVKSDGTLWSSGQGTEFQLGYGTVNTNVFSQAGVDSDWSAVSITGRVSYAVKTDGSVYTCGSSFQGLLGLGNSITEQQGFVRVGTDLWKSIVVGVSCVVGIRDDNAIYGWGSDSFFDYYPLGSGTGADYLYVPFPLPLGPGVLVSNNQYSGAYYAIGVVVSAFWANFHGQREST
jgi:alpha-tubulin suppressor-like RCC1 family protein